MYGHVGASGCPAPVTPANKNHRDRHLRAKSTCDSGTSHHCPPSIKQTSTDQCQILTTSSTNTPNSLLCHCSKAVSISPSVSSLPNLNARHIHHVRYLRPQWHCQRRFQRRFQRRSPGPEPEPGILAVPACRGLHLQCQSLSDYRKYGKRKRDIGRSRLSGAKSLSFTESQAQLYPLSRSRPPIQSQAEFHSQPPFRAVASAVLFSGAF